MTHRRASVIAASTTLQHAPDLVRYGSKPTRSPVAFADSTGHLRSFEQAVRYPPNQVFIGNLAPEALWDLPRPWWGEGPEPGDAAPSTGPFGEMLTQTVLYDLLEEADQFDLVHRGSSSPPGPTDLVLFDGMDPVGSIRADHGDDANLTAGVLLENLLAKAGAIHATRCLLRQPAAQGASISLLIGAGEEAVGDRYQRGGGGLAKSVAEAVGLRECGGLDLKAFCAAPVHAMIVAASLVESAVHDYVVVVAGGSLAKLGMKFEAGVKSGAPILEDVLASTAILIGPDRGDGPTVRLDAVGIHRVASGSSQQAMLEDLVARPLGVLGRSVPEIGRYATELHNPEITEPAAGGDVPDRNYRMIAALGVIRGEIDHEEIPLFARSHGLPGYSPTQGHIASAVPWLPPALARFREGQLHSTMLMAKGSLFLGRLTRLWDGVSVILEA